MHPLIDANNMLFRTLAIRDSVFSFVGLVRSSHFISGGKITAKVLKIEVTWSLLVTNSTLYAASAMKSIYPIASRNQMHNARNTISYNVTVRILRIIFTSPQIWYQLSDEGQVSLSLSVA